MKSDRMIGRQAEQTPMAGSTLVHKPALTNSPACYVRPVRLQTLIEEYLQVISTCSRLFRITTRTIETITILAISVRQKRQPFVNWLDSQSPEQKHTGKRNLLRPLDLERPDHGQRQDQDHSVQNDVRYAGPKEEGL